MEVQEHASGSSLRQIWWHVLFFRTKKRRWWDIFNPDWARHCCAYSWNPSKSCWIFVDPSSVGTIVSVLDHEELQWIIDEWVSEGSLTAKLLYRTPDEPLSVLRHRGLQTCSTVLGRIMGVKGSALRPVDLHRSLVAENAEVKELPL